MKPKLDGLLEKLGWTIDSSVGVAFSGGGVKGFAHIGILMAFERFGLKPDIMSGVSAGSIAAVLYASGLGPKDIIKCFTDSSKLGDFTEFALPKESFMKLDKFGKLLDSWLPVKYLEDLKIPTVVCATDLDQGKSVGWSKGEIVPRVMASCSIPVIFKPIRIGNSRYVDGGVLRNLPAWAIRSYCKTLYGCNCSPARKLKDPKANITDIAYRTFHLMMKSNIPQDLKLCDHIIEVPNMTGTFDMSYLLKGVNAGYEAASKTLEKIL